MWIVWNVLIALFDLCDSFRSRTRKGRGASAHLPNRSIYQVSTQQTVGIESYQYTRSFPFQYKAHADRLTSIFSVDLILLFLSLIASRSVANKARTNKVSRMMSGHEIEMEPMERASRHRRPTGGISTYRDYSSSPTKSPASLQEYCRHTAFDVEVMMAQVLAEDDANGRPRHFANNFEEAIFVFTVMMATAATTFLQGVIVINTMSIADSLAMTTAQTTWITASIG